MALKMEEILRSIDSKDVEFIQRMVKVEYDNGTQRILKFFYQGREYKVTEVLGTFKGDLSFRDLAFLVRTQDEDVYLLYLYFIDSMHQNFLSRSWWILSFRILKDEELMFLYREERKMLVNMHLKKITDFHGHLCPDLVIGCRASEMALEILSQKEEMKGGLTVIAENNTSALDAIQCITGCTLGNQRLVVSDFGKHKYTFIINRSGLAVALSLKEQHFGDEQIYLEIEEKIIKNEATIEEIAHFQRLIDERVKTLISLKSDELFEVMETRRRPPKTEVPTVFLRCPHCGDLVLRAKLVKMEGLFICRPCFDQLIHIPADVTYN